ncbi:MAG: YqgE/AlgH family protein [Pseudomonadales bacterium]|nr:YqgE/AlgH family protein [Pseudomonadales bacterium]
MRYLPGFIMLLVSTLPARAADTATVLVAAGGLHDGFFDHSVVLIYEHGAHSETIGLILNRPMERTLGELSDLKTNHPFYNVPVYRGGPVAPKTLVGLVASENRPDDALEIADGVYMTLNLGVIEEHWDDLKVSRIQIFLGYAGWAAGQLDAEVEIESWKFALVTTDDMFLDDTSGLWEKLHARPPPRMAAMY